MNRSRSFYEGGLREAVHSISLQVFPEVSSVRFALVRGGGSPLWGTIWGTIEGTGFISRAKTKASPVRRDISTRINRDLHASPEWVHSQKIRGDLRIMV